MEINDTLSNQEITYGEQNTFGENVSFSQTISDPNLSVNHTLTKYHLSCGDCSSGPSSLKTRASSTSVLSVDIQCANVFVKRTTRSGEKPSP